MTSPRHAAVIGGNRIPFARADGPYATESNQAMLTAAIDGLAARFSLGGQRVDEVVAGAVLKHARDFPRNAEPRTGLSMGEHAARTAKEWGITREAQDELAAASHINMAAAYDRGFFDNLVTPYAGQQRDQNLRQDSSADKLSELKPVFGDTMTAGNSTPLTDGAAVVLLASDEWAEAHGIPVLAHLTHVQTAAVDYVDGNDGLLMAPVYAVPKLLEKAGLTLQDFDFYEIHEAFASQVLATLAAWEKNGLGTIDRAKLNVNGSSLAAGHPFAATGGG